MTANMQMQVTQISSHIFTQPDHLRCRKTDYARWKITPTIGLVSTAKYSAQDNLKSAKKEVLKVFS